MATAAFAEAVGAAVTVDSLRNVFLQAHRGRFVQRCALKGELPDRSPTLELVAKDLRRQIVAQFLAAGLPEVEGESPATASVAPRDPPSLVVGPEQSGPVCVSITLQDPAEDPLPTKVSEVHVDENEQSEVQLGCPHCRRPLEVMIRSAAAADIGPAVGPVPSELAMVVEGSATASAHQERHAYCAVLSSGSKPEFLQALALGRSVVSSGCVKERVLLHSLEVPSPYLEVLTLFWTLQPLRSWPRFLSRMTSGSWKLGVAPRLLALELTQYSKVLVLELGCIVRGSLDILFDLECPAALLRPCQRRPWYANPSSFWGEEGGRDNVPTLAAATQSGSCRLDMSMLLLQPSAQALNRMMNEVGNDSLAWPPRGLYTEGRPYFHLEDYLLRFYSAFFRGSWTEIPEELAPVRISDESLPLPRDEPHCVHFRTGWDSLERSIHELRKAKDPLCTQAQHVLHDEGGAPAFLAGVLQSAECGVRLLDVIGKVDRKRCGECGIYDAEGTSDPIDHRWRCRFCWEGMLLDASLQEQCGLPLSPGDAEALRSELGPFCIDARQQRWAWAQGPFYTWVEFRLRGVLWTRDSGVGSWELVKERGGKVRLSIHTCSRHGTAEFRHLLHLLNGQQTGKSVELEEVRREVSRPLGFFRLSSDQKVRMWPWHPHVSMVDATSARHGEHAATSAPATPVPVVAVPATPASSSCPANDGADSRAVSLSTEGMDRLATATVSDMRTADVGSMGDAAGLPASL